MKKIPLLPFVSLFFLRDEDETGTNSSISISSVIHQKNLRRGSKKELLDTSKSDSVLTVGITNVKFQLAFVIPHVL